MMMESKLENAPVRKGAIPSMETFEYFTREGILRDSKLLEKAVLKARNQIGAECC